MCMSLPLEGRKEDYMNALTKPHGSCRGPSGSDMHMQQKKTENKNEAKRKAQNKTKGRKIT